MDKISNIIHRDSNINFMESYFNRCLLIDCFELRDRSSKKSVSLRDTLSYIYDKASDGVVIDLPIKDLMLYSFRLASLYNQDILKELHVPDSILVAYKTFSDYIVNHWDKTLGSLIPKNQDLSGFYVCRKGESLDD